MKTLNSVSVLQQRTTTVSSTPRLCITKLGIVSRDYRSKYQNGYRDFSHTLPNVLELLDDQGCDAALFSLFSIVPRNTFDIRTILNKLKNIKAVFIEEFEDKDNRSAIRYVVYYRDQERWEEYEFRQQFGSLSDMSQAAMFDFVKKEMPKRILGNCCVLLCGETNGVKYSPKDKNVNDTFGLRSAIPEATKIILNPIHDRMTRFEMKLKREFLSKNGRWVISVWNKGKVDSNGKTRDGQNPAWTVFYDGMEKFIEPIPNHLGVEVGILDVRKA